MGSTFSASLMRPQLVDRAPEIARLESAGVEWQAVFTVRVILLSPLAR
jgi:hypothetical protein